MFCVEIHPGKTFIGRVERYFDFLGYFLKPGVLRASVVTLINCGDRISRLYLDRLREKIISIDLTKLRAEQYWDRSYSIVKLPG